MFSPCLCSFCCAETDISTASIFSSTSPFLQSISWECLKPERSTIQWHNQANSVCWGRLWGTIKIVLFFFNSKNLVFNPLVEVFFGDLQLHKEAAGEKVMQSFSIICCLAVEEWNKSSEQDIMWWYSTWKKKKELHLFCSIKTEKNTLSHLLSCTLKLLQN